MSNSPPIPVTQTEVDNILHRLNLGRADIAALPEGATIAVNITTHRQVADIIQRLWNARVPRTPDPLAADCREAFDSWCGGIWRKADVMEPICAYSAWEGWQAAWSEQENRTPDLDKLIEKLEAYQNKLSQTGQWISAGACIEIVRQHQAESPSPFFTNAADAIAWLKQPDKPSEIPVIDPRPAIRQLVGHCLGADELTERIAEAVRPHLRTSEPVLGRWRTGCTYCGHDFDGHHEGCKWFEKESDQPDADGLREDLDQLIRVCLTNPGDVRGFIEANYPKEYAIYAGECPSGSRIGSTEAQVQGHAGSNPASSAPVTGEVEADSGRSALHSSATGPKGDNLASPSTEQPVELSPLDKVHTTDGRPQHWRETLDHKIKQTEGLSFLNEGELAQFQIDARRDDIFSIIVPSDVRRMIAEIYRLREPPPTMRESGPHSKPVEFWNPIETAPKDARCVYIILMATQKNKKCGGNMRTYVAYYDYERNLWCRYGSKTPLESEFWAVTHWVSLPMPTFAEDNQRRGTDNG